jgi:Outer membrane protein beta-barrel domain
MSSRYHFRSSVAKLSAALSVATLSLAVLVLPCSALAQTQQDGSSSADYAALLTPDAGGSASPSASPGPQYGRRSQQQYAYHSYRSRFAAEAGGGFNAPVNDTENAQTWGWNATGGVGYKFAPDLAIMAEYQFIRTGIPDAVLATVGEPGGNVHTWSLTLDPVLTYKNTGSWGGYVTGGGGFYRKLTSFTQPVDAIGQYCDFFTCYPYYYTTNVVVSHYSSNQAGFNIGTGLTFGGWNSGKFYAEARYTWLDTPGRATEMVPVTFGFRW